MYKSPSFSLFVFTVLNSFAIGNSLKCYVCVGNGTSACATDAKLLPNETCPFADSQCVVISEGYFNRTISSARVRRFCANGQGNYCLSFQSPNLSDSNYITDTLCESCDTDFCNSQPLSIPSFIIRVIHTVIGALAPIFQYFRF